jgi:uncharacterized PurR-regulated membrane protein YhhQ (DUF165 family)
MNLPSDIIRDESGKLSARKVVFLVWMVAILVIWCYLSWIKSEMQNFPSEVKWLVGILSGTYIGGNYIEKNPKNSVDEPPKV